MRAHQVTALPFNQDGADRRCDGEGCGGRALFFQSNGRSVQTGLPVISRRWCGACVPAAFFDRVTRRKAVA